MVYPAGRRVHRNAPEFRMNPQPGLRPLRLGIDTHQELTVYMRADCPVCRSEGFEAHRRVLVAIEDRHMIGTLNVVHGNWLEEGYVGLSEAAWQTLLPQPGNLLHFRHPPTVASMSMVRGKIYGHTLTDRQYQAIIRDMVAGLYTDVELAAFITACSGNRMQRQEISSLTRAMVNSGETLEWGADNIVDKHCVGGLPGNRTTPIVVAIAAANGLIMPKTSSRAITSPAGTADTMETLTSVNLPLPHMRRVVEREGGCIAWGGAVHLSPADDILIRVERALDLDSEGQLVASILSKKAAAGSTHVLIDIPVGPTAKVRDQRTAAKLTRVLRSTAEDIGLKLRSVITDGHQPVGRGIGPALEALDILAVLQNTATAPQDLRQRALQLAAELLELGGAASAGQGMILAEQTLASGLAWAKFQAICEAQGGLKEPPRARLTHAVLSPVKGRVCAIDNRRLAKVAKLAGAPAAPAAGLVLHCHLHDPVEAGMPLYTVHAETPGEMEYARDFIEQHPQIIHIEPQP